MAIFQEDFLRCSKCECKDFEEKVIITVSKYAKKVRRENNEPLPAEVLEKKTIYVCRECKTILDV